MDLSTTTIVAVILFSSVALYTDLRSRRIPNWLTVTAAISGLVWHTTQAGFSGMGTSLGGFASGFGLLLLLWMIGGGGGGDVKLMGAIGAWLGAMPTLLVFVGSAGFALLCTLVLVVHKHLQRASSQRISIKHRDNHETDSVALGSMTVPYALPVAMAIWSLLMISIL